MFGAAGCDPVLVVVGGSHAQPVTLALERQGRARVVVNPDPSRGMLSSLQVGLKAALLVGATQVAFAPVDVPLSSSAPIAAVLAGAGP